VSQNRVTLCFAPLSGGALWGEPTREKIVEAALRAAHPFTGRTLQEVPIYIMYEILMRRYRLANTKNS